MKRRIRSTKSDVVIQFSDQVAAELFVDWMNNLGEQLYWQQYDVDKEFTPELQGKFVDFRYFKSKPLVISAKSKKD